jgi:hypothetical protein
MRSALKFIVLASLVSGCATDRYPLPEPAPEWVKEKARATYAKTYWHQIYPDMRDCMYIPGKPGYFAAFMKGDPDLLKSFPREVTKWDEIIVDFDGQLQITQFHKVRY